MAAIRNSGWACSTLYASDREDGGIPVMLDGSHRLEALRRLLKSNETSWLLRTETPENFKVTVNVLKGLTPEEEGLVGREANYLNSRRVCMTLVDHITATHRAVIATRLRLNLKQGEALTAETLRKVHPDFRRYVESTIRAWKGLAEGLSDPARKLLLRVHASGLRSEQGEVRRAFSKKTLVESKMMAQLRNYPGAQFWYLKRLIDLEADDKIRKYKAPYFKELIEQLKGFSDACTQFAGYLKHTFKLAALAKQLEEIVQKGRPAENKGPLKSFAHNYLWTSKREKEVEALVQLRKKDYKMFPYVFYQLVAQLHFKEDYEQVDKMFAAPEANRRVKFTSPVDPTQENLNYRKLLQKRRYQIPSSTEQDAPARKKQKKAAPERKTQTTTDQEQGEDQEQEHGEEHSDKLRARKKQKRAAPERKTQTTTDQEQGEDQEQEHGEEHSDKLHDEHPEDLPPDPNDHDESEPQEKNKGKSIPPQPLNTSLSLHVYQNQSSPLASILVQDITKLIERINLPPGEKITLKVRQKGKPATERSFN